MPIPGMDWAGYRPVQDMVTLGKPRIKYRAGRDLITDLRFELTGITNCGVWGGIQKGFKNNFLMTPKLGLYQNENIYYKPRTVYSDQLEAKDYAKECLLLQASSAGRKAHDLLFEFLNEQQKWEYTYLGYFHVRCAWFNYSSADLNFLDISEEDLDDKDLCKERGGVWETNYELLFRIHRWYPNGNVFFCNPETGKGEANMCYHPAEPYPLDDILLTQLTQIQSNCFEFIKNANIGRSNKSHEKTIEKAAQEMSRRVHYTGRESRETLWQDC